MQNIIDHNAIPNDSSDSSPALIAAIAAAVPGETVLIPAGEYWLDTPVRIKKSVEIVGEGDASILKHRKELHAEGTTGILHLGVRKEDTSGLITDGVSISDLSFRGLTDGTTRTIAINVRADCRNVTIERVFFDHIGANCVSINASNGQNENIFVRNCRANEFTEQFVEIAGGNVRGVRMEDNHLRSTKGNPAIGTIEPYGFMIEMKWRGIVENIWVCNNDISFEGMSEAEIKNSGGICIHSIMANCEWATHRNIYFIGNKIRHVGAGVRCQGLRKNFDQPGSLYIINNEVSFTRLGGVLVHRGPVGEGPQDKISVIDNKLSLPLTGTLRAIEINTRCNVISGGNVTE